MDLTEKNKGAYKLQNFGPIYCINLDGQPERWQYMEDQYKYWQLTDYERISAYDGREDDLSDIIKGKYPDTMSSGEIGCVTSHLKAIADKPNRDMEYHSTSAYTYTFCSYAMGTYTRHSW